MEISPNPGLESANLSITSRVQHYPLSCYSSTLQIERERASNLTVAGAVLS